MQQVRRQVVCIPLFSNSPQTASSLRYEKLKADEAKKFGDVEVQLAAEISNNDLKKMVLTMVDARLGALEAISSEMLKLQSSSLESLRQLHNKVPTPATPAPAMSAAERDRRMREYERTLNDEK